MKEVKVIKVDAETGRKLHDFALQMLRLARFCLVRMYYPYLAPLAYQLRFVPYPHVHPYTIAIDQYMRVYINPFFIIKLHSKAKNMDIEEIIEKIDTLDPVESERDIVEILRHEIEHIFRLHFRRAREIDAMNLRWNIAADLEINSHLPPLSIPVKRPAEYGLPSGLSAEEYYISLPDEPQGGVEYGVLVEMEGACPVDGCGDFRRWGEEEGSGAGNPFRGELDPDDEECRGANEAERQSAIQQTAREIVNYHKSRGELPSDLVRLAERILCSKIDWRRVLGSKLRRRLMEYMSGKRDYTYRRLNRRMDAYKPFLLPAQVDYRFNKVGVVIDTSGSISSGELEQAVAETLAIVRQTGAKVDAYICDANVHRVVRNVRNYNQLRELVGGGGTDMRVGIEKAVEDGCDCVVVLTDGYSPFPEEKISVPLIVGLVGENATEESVPNWADIVRIEVDEEAKN